MNKCSLVKLLTTLNTNLSDSTENLEEIFQKKYEEISAALRCSDDVVKILTTIGVNNVYKETFEWKYICQNFYILNLLDEELSKNGSEILSVQETKSVRTALSSLILHGILKNLQPNLPHRVLVQTSESNIEDKDVFYDYYLLKCTAIGLFHFMNRPNLRMLIIPHHLQAIMVAVYQVAYCTLKKPQKTSNTKFVMTEETYIKLLEDQVVFKDLLEKMNATIHPSIFIKETMVLFKAQASLWFKKAVSSTLTKIMRSKKGVQNIALTLLDGVEDDTAKTWKILDVLTKIVLSCRTLPDFRENICSQLLDLICVRKTINHRQLLIFERLVVSCTKSLYCEDKELCNEFFIEKMMKLLFHFTSKHHKFCDHSEITDDLKQTVRLLHGCFLENSVNSACLPINLIGSFIGIIFYLYHLSVKSAFHSTHKELKELLIKYLKSCSAIELHHLLDNFLFGFTVKDVHQFRDDVIVRIDEKIVVENCSHTVIHATADVMTTVYDLLNTEQKIFLFGYLLKVITQKEKYLLTTNNSKELLGSEVTASNTALERLLTMHTLLVRLAENKDVQCSLRNKPDDIIGYAQNVLCSKSSEAHLLFIIIMILDSLISNAKKNTLFKYTRLLEPLNNIIVNTKDNELKTLCNKVVTTLKKEHLENSEAVQHETNSEFDKALEDVRDTLLPTRGHGLLVLSKLVEEKDKQAMERKHYLLNLFQLHLKDEDSFIYLNAIQGLAALADVFPDVILEILCEEYTDFSKKDGENVRMKLGEVLMRVVKLLGEMAPKYKATLINTFLSGTKDDDHLIRASSLSNLGELCRVLNYSLGTIVSEVLVCVHAVITTDKAVEPRRAAVTVIRQLFVGLQSEMITFLKDEILPIYRTLKEVYYNDKDDVMRLQAQLALEELNENMKTIVFTTSQLHLEKKIIALN